MFGFDILLPYDDVVNKCKNVLDDSTIWGLDKFSWEVLRSRKILQFHNTTFINKDSIMIRCNDGWCPKVPPQACVITTKVNKLRMMKREL